ncbi:MAG: damage-control phosphatase ARMT1 family protein [Promethearchaeota archaeon]
MKETFITPDCGPCFVDTALRFLKEGTKDETKILNGLQRIFQILARNFSSKGYTFIIGNEMAREINDLLSDETSDIFEEIKDRSNKVCESIYPDLLKRYKEIKDINAKLKFVLASGVAGNVIDVGTAGHNFTLDADEISKLIDKIQDEGFAIDNTVEFKALLGSEEAHRFLIMLDNAGEIVFDKLMIILLKEHDKHVTCMVRGAPIANDATIDDIKQVGLDVLCDDIIETTIASLGYTIPDNDPHVIERVNSMDVIIGKGQANLETLSVFVDEIEAKHIFLLSQIKCNTVAKFQGVEKGKNIFKKLK